jgi:glycosyltransferase involved in cell wall biosynthesis
VKIAYLAAGAAGMYCGGCLRDNALALELRALGQSIVLLPAYTPLRVDGESASEERVFLGAVDVYLQQKFARFRGRRGILGAVLGSQTILRWLSRFSFSTQSRDLGPLTVSMLRAEEGNQARSLAELIQWLRDDFKPDLVHLTNLLFCGFAPEMKRALGVPVICGLQGEDLFLDGLPEPFRREALDLICGRGAAVDRFIAVSSYYAGKAAQTFGIDPARIDVVPGGTRLEDYLALPEKASPSGALSIGYFARIAPEKGLHLLAAAFERLSAPGRFPGLRLKAAGYLGRDHFAYAAGVRRALATWGLSRQAEILGTLDGQAKLEFFRGIDVLSVPTVHPEPRGLFVLEALASGVPVVGPRHGVFPELLEATESGLLHEPEDPGDLASKLARVLEDGELRRRLGEKGRRTVREEFSSRGLAERTLAAYRKCVGTDIP